MASVFISAVSKLGLCAAMAGGLTASGSTPQGLKLDLDHRGAPGQGQHASGTVSFAIFAAPVGGLYPGARKKLKLVVTNPFPYDMKVTSLTGRLVSTSKSRCAPVAANLVVRPYSGRPSLPFVVSAHQQRSAGSIDLYMPNTVADSCQRAEFTITFQGSAMKVRQ